MQYRHRWANGEAVDWPPSKAVCVGRNYAEHARELGNPVPEQPLLFIKPATAMVALDAPWSLPQGRGPVHHEAEIAILVGDALSGATDPVEVRRAIAGVGLALDLTLRGLQDTLKQRGQPWERAKAFDGACPLSPFLPLHQAPPLDQLSLSLAVNDEIRQSGHCRQMLWPIDVLLVEISQWFTLWPGDVVLTGTPPGVAELLPGDRLRLTLGQDHLVVKTTILGSPT